MARRVPCEQWFLQAGRYVASGLEKPLLAGWQRKRRLKSEFSFLQSLRLFLPICFVKRGRTLLKLNSTTGNIQVQEEKYNFVEACLRVKLGNFTS